MERLRATLSDYRRDARHRCTPVPQATRDSTLCCNGVNCVGMPGSVTVHRSAVEWLHACSVLWTEDEWDAFTRAFPRWTVNINACAFCVFPVRSPETFGNKALIISPQSVGVMVEMGLARCQPNSETRFTWRKSPLSNTV